MKIVIKNGTLQFQSQQETELTLTKLTKLLINLDSTPQQFATSTSAARCIYYAEAVSGVKYHVTFETDGSDSDKNSRYGAGFCTSIPADSVQVSNTTQATNSEGTRSLDVEITAPSNGYIWFSIFEDSYVTSKSIARKNF